jgi:hypothetical protein
MRRIGNLLALALFGLFVNLPNGSMAATPPVAEQNVVAEVEGGNDHLGRLGEQSAFSSFVLRHACL